MIVTGLISLDPLPKFETSLHKQSLLNMQNNRNYLQDHSWISLPIQCTKHYVSMLFQITVRDKKAKLRRVYYAYYYITDIIKLVC